MAIPDYLTCLLRNLYAGQEATVRTGHRKRSTSRLYMSPCLFNFYAQYIMRNAGLEEAQAGIKIAGRNINNLRYADDPLEKEMAIHSSIPAWRIPWIEEPGSLQSTGRKESDTTEQIQFTSLHFMQMTPPLWQKVKRN